MFCGFPLPVVLKSVHCWITLWILTPLVCHQEKEPLYKAFERILNIVSHLHLRKNYSRSRHYVKKWCKIRLKLQSTKIPSQVGLLKTTSEQHNLVIKMSHLDFYWILLFSGRCYARNSLTSSGNAFLLLYLLSFFFFLEWPRFLFFKFYFQNLSLYIFVLLYRKSAS